MKISTWNLMRPTGQTILRNNIFHDTIKKVNPDILILTETNSIINPGTEYSSVSTTKLPGKFENINYSKGENRVTIFSKFPFAKQFKPTDEYTSICTEVVTPLGTLIVYGTIIGVTGGKDKRFHEDFEKQKSDIIKLSSGGNLCVAGDFNISFSGYAYPSLDTIKKAKVFFDNASLEILTKDILDSPDHICLSKSVLKNMKIQPFPQYFEKNVTDHMLVSVIVTF